MKTFGIPMAAVAATISAGAPAARFVDPAAIVVPGS